MGLTRVSSSSSASLPALTDDQDEHRLWNLVLCLQRRHWDPRTAEETEEIPSPLRGHGRSQEAAPIGDQAATHKQTAEWLARPPRA